MEKTLFEDVSRRIHVWNIYHIFTYILLIFMVNVGIYILRVPWILWVSPITIQHGDLAQMEWLKKGVNPSHAVEEMNMSILQQTNITMENQLHFLRTYNVLICIICTFFQHKSGTSGGNIP